MNANKGFTLIELLVVVAIIGVLSTIVITNLSSSREGSYDAAVKANLSSIRTQAEVYFNNNLNYGPELASAACPTSGTSIFNADTTVKSAIASAKSANGGTDPTCEAVDSGTDNNADKWAVYSPLRSSGGWCVDSTGYSGSATGVSSGACSSS